MLSYSNFRFAFFVSPSLSLLGNRNRYRTPITSASVFDTLLEGPKMSYSVLGSGNSNSNSSTSDSSSTESLRNGASGSGEIARTRNGATVLQNTLGDSIDNETITWNWNPQASSKLNFESKCGPSDNINGHASHMAHNCYGQKRIRNTTSTDDASASGAIANGKNLSIWSHQDTTDGTDVKSTNFWSKVLFNNNSNSSSSGNSSTSSSSSSSNNKDPRRTNNLFPSASNNTAVIFNSIISNLKDHHPKSIDLSDMDVIDRNFNMPAAIVRNAGDGNTASTSTAVAGASSLPPGSDSGLDLKSKNLSQKHKTVKNRSDKNEHSNFEVADGVFRLSLDNDLNAANSTFLRALNDLHLDYNDLTGATNAMVNRQEHYEPTVQSKERYAQKITPE